MKGIKLFLLSSSLLMASASVFATTDIQGTWRTIDDKTGFSKGIVKITKSGDGTYSGKTLRSFHALVIPLRQLVKSVQVL